MAERSITVDGTAIHRWTVRYLRLLDAVWLFAGLREKQCLATTPTLNRNTYSKGAGSRTKHIRLSERREF